MKTLTSLAVVLILAAAVPARVFSETRMPWSLRDMSPPKFSDSERRAELARRRSEVAAKMADNSTLVLFGAEPKLYTNDVDYVFRQENNLFYLTSLAQAGAMFVMTKNGSVVQEFVFLPKRDPRTETWQGKMYSDEEAADLSGIQNIINADERGNFVKAIKEKRPFSSNNGKLSNLPPPAVLYLLLPFSGADENGSREYAAEQVLAQTVAALYKVENARPIFNALRQIKSPYEIAMLRYAIDITSEAQMRAMASASRAKMEYEVQAEIEYTFRRRNADFWGYPSIVGSGPNATTLHYQEPAGPVIPNSLLLVDVGAEYKHYTADVTRTFPVNGKFSKEQAEIYQIVFESQKAAAKAARPGATMQQIGNAAANVIKNGLFRLGLITDKNSDQYRMWFMHGIGHGIGMNVHDAGADSSLRAGMVFTIEPGIYIRGDALDYLPDTPKNKEFLASVRPAFEKYKNIGVRIEDDLLVTTNGVEWLTKNLPRQIGEIESFMRNAAIEAP